MDADVIIVSAQHEEELAADRAEVLVSVEGSSLVTGRAALQKAKEVSRLVEELAKVGIGEPALEGVRAEVSSGILSKSSSANYRLRVKIDELALLPDALGAITGAKNVRLEALLWRYPESVEKQAGWLKAALADANLKAAAMAEALGTKIVGVHKCTEQPINEAAPQAAYFGGDMTRARKSANVDLGFELGHKKRVGVSVTVEYRVG
jgi:uncharacterized protein YggE